MRRQPVNLSRLAGAIPAIAWAVAFGCVLGAIGWHDPVVKTFWNTQLANHSLFLNSAGKPLPQAATWVAIMRFEGDFSVGLLAASVGVVIVAASRRVVGPRDRPGPGLVACVVAVGAMGLCVLEAASSAAKQRQALWPMPYNPFPNAWPNYELRIGVAVIAAWAVLAASRRWRPRASAVDRVGRAVGFLWLVALGYRIVACLFIPFNNWGY